MKEQSLTQNYGRLWFWPHIPSNILCDFFAKCLTPCLGLITGYMKMSQGILSVKWFEYLKHIPKSIASIFTNLKTWVPLEAEE